MLVVTSRGYPWLVYRDQRRTNKETLEQSGWRVWLITFEGNVNTSAIPLGVLADDFQLLGSRFLPLFFIVFIRGSRNILFFHHFHYTFRTFRSNDEPLTEGEKHFAFFAASDDIRNACNPTDSLHGVLTNDELSNQLYSLNFYETDHYCWPDKLCYWCLRVRIGVFYKVN